MSDPYPKIPAGAFEALRTMSKVQFPNSMGQQLAETIEKSGLLKPPAGAAEAYAAIADTIMAVGGASAKIDLSGGAFAALQESSGVFGNNALSRALEAIEMAPVDHQGLAMARLAASQMIRSYEAEDPQIPTAEGDEDLRQESAAVLANYWQSIKGHRQAAMDFLTLVVAILALAVAYADWKDDPPGQPHPAPYSDGRTGDEQAVTRRSPASAPQDDDAHRRPGPG